MLYSGMEHRSQLPAGLEALACKGRTDRPALPDHWDDELRFSAHRTRWQVAAGWQAILFGPEGPRWEALGMGQLVTAIKRGAHRTVYRVELSGRHVYVKHFHSKRWLGIAMDLACGSPARREGRRLQAIARRGVATARPVAWGERVWGGVVTESYLVTEDVGGACTLDEYLSHRVTMLSSNERAGARRQLFRGLGRWLAQIHEAGIYHRDLHAGNILVSPAADGDPLHSLDFYLIDAWAVRFGKPLCWPLARENLTTLAAIGRDSTTRSERLRFWRNYVAHRSGAGLPDLASVNAELQTDAWRFLRRLHRRRDKRSLRTNRDYRAIRGSAARLHCLQTLSDAVLRELGRDPDATFWKHIEQPVKLSHSSLVVRATLSTSDGPRSVAYKCYRPRNWWKAFCRLFGGDRALRSWRLGQALYERGISTARPLVVISPSRPRFGRRTYLATEWVEGAENLHLYGWRLAKADEAQRGRQAARCARSLGRLLGRMHAWGISHGDLKATNLLVVDRGEQIETYVIDTDDVRLTRHQPPKTAAADLARLAAGLAAHPWVSRTMCCRFLREYARQFPRGTIDWKQFWKEISRSAARIAARKRRRGETVL